MNGNYLEGEDALHYILIKLIFYDPDPTGSFSAKSEKQSLMKSAKPIQYQFIPADDTHLENTGFCVIDQITKIYGGLISSLTKDNLIRQIEEIEASITVDFIEVYQSDQSVVKWSLDQGVRVDTLNNI